MTSTGSLRRAGHGHTHWVHTLAPALQKERSFLLAASPKNAAPALWKASIEALSKEQDYKLHRHRLDQSQVEQWASSPSFQSSLALFLEVAYGKVDEELSQRQWTLRGRRNQSILCGQIRPASSCLWFFPSIANFHLWLTTLQHLTDKQISFPPNNDPAHLNKLLVMRFTLTLQHLFLFK